MFSKKKTEKSTNIDQAVELGTINYLNLDASKRHGDFETALTLSRETGKPLFCNFVEWSG